MKQKWLILFVLLLIKFIVQYHLISPEYELHRDEFLHLDQANHLAWGYTSVPPVTSWISCLIKALGNSVFWVKFFPALFGALTILLVWKTIELLKGDLFALILGSSCILFSVLFRLNTLYQPNSLDVLCWTMFYYFLLKYLNDKKDKWLLCLALSFAIGFLNKYNIIFLIMGVIPALLISRERRILQSTRIYLFVLLTFLLILPNLLWQYKNDFPVFRHLSELSETQLVHVNRSEFLAAQMLFFPGTFLIILFGFYALLRYKPFERYKLFSYAFFITMGIFLIFRAKDYYAIGLYPVFFAFGAVYLSSLMLGRVGRILRPVAILLVIGLFVPVYQIAFPNKSPEQIVAARETYEDFGMLRWEDGQNHALPQDFADMLGWKELAEKVDQTWLSIPASTNTLILCDNYGQAGAINYYSKLGLQAVSFNADYRSWFDLQRPYQNVIRIKQARERSNEMKETAPYFKNASIADSVTNFYAREYGTTIFAFTEATIDVNQRVLEEIQSYR